MRTANTSAVKSVVNPKNMTDREKNQLTKDWMELIYKIATQQSKKSGVSFDETLSFAMEGWADALNTYNPEKANGQTFQQYAAYRMAHFCLNGINEESRTIKVSKYMRDKMAAGETETVSTTSLDTTFDGEDCYTDHCIAIAVDDIDMEAEETGIFGNLFKALEKNFSQRDCEIFYSKYGFNGRPEMACKELTAKYGISVSRISKILQAIYDFILKDEELADELRDFMTEC